MTRDTAEYTRVARRETTSRDDVCRFSKSATDPRHHSTTRVDPRPRERARENAKTAITSASTIATFTAVSRAFGRRVGTSSSASTAVASRTFPSPRRPSRDVRAMSTADQKRAKQSHKTICTHDGAFHCDEALGCHLLRRTEAAAGAAVDRSRDAERWGAADVVIDVGAVYDCEKMLFDHHQRGFEETFGHGFATKLSSAGLVYKHFGKRSCASASRGGGGVDADERTVRKIYLKMYEEFIEGVDGNDNGVNVYDTDAPAKYKDNTNLPARVKRLNPAWDEPSTPERQMEQFEKAVALTGSEFDDMLGITPRSGFRRGRTSSARWTRRRACTRAGRFFPRDVLSVEGAPVRTRGRARDEDDSQVCAVARRQGVPRVDDSSQRVEFRVS